MFLYNDNLSVKSKVAYISTSFWLLADGSRDLSQAEKEMIVYEQTPWMTIIFTQKGLRLSFSVKIVLILWIYSALQAVVSFWGWNKSRDPTANSQKLKYM